MYDLERFDRQSMHMMSLLDPDRGAMILRYMIPELKLKLHRLLGYGNMNKHTNSVALAGALSLYTYSFFCCWCRRRRCGRRRCCRRCCCCCWGGNI